MNRKSHVLPCKLQDLIFFIIGIFPYIRIVVTSCTYGTLFCVSLCNNTVNKCFVLLLYSDLTFCHSSILQHIGYIYIYIYNLDLYCIYIYQSSQQNNSFEANELFFNFLQYFFVIKPKFQLAIKI